MATRTTYGSAFPGSPYTNEPFMRTDLGLWCYYDGTRWLTAHEYTLNFAEATVSATANGTITWIGDTLQPYFSRIEARTYVDTTNDGSNYWTLAVRSILLDNTVTTVTTFNTSGDAADTYVDNSEDADTTVPANYGGAYIRYVTTGTPGDLTYSITARYRLIIT